MKKIGLFLSVAPHAGGMFQYAESLIDALSVLPKDTYQVTVATTHTGWDAILSTYGLSYYSLKAPAISMLISQALMASLLPAKIERFFTHLINPIAWQMRRFSDTLWIFPAQEALAYQLKIKAVASIHDLMHRYEPHFPEVSKGFRFAIREHRFSNICHYAQAILVDSNIGKQHVIESYQTRADKIFPLPYIPAKTIVYPIQNTGIKTKYQLPDTFLFYPAQLWAHKNHLRLIEAAASIRDTCPNIHLVFTGFPSHQHAHITAAIKYFDMGKHITFVGYVDTTELPHFYSQARGLIFPSFFGPTNIPPLEAMIYRCPMAVSNIYAMPEQCGDAAIYFDPTSVDSIAHACKRLWLDNVLCENLKNNALQQSRKWTADDFKAALQTMIDFWTSR